MPRPDIRPHPTVHYVAFPTLDREASIRVAAQLRVPANDGEAPAVVIVHGTNGVDSRGMWHARALNEAGIATLEPDMWSARDLAGDAGPGGRPETVTETLPDAFGALAWLASRPEIDSRRIGIMGFSWGGIVAMLTATRRYSDMHMGEDALRFAAHAPFYPICWTCEAIPEHAFTGLTDAPIFIQTGECDDYDEPDTCARLLRSLPAHEQHQVSCTVYPGAAHAFDRLEPSITVDDPYSHLGQGGKVRMEAEPDAAARSRQATVEFFTRTFRTDPSEQRSPGR